MKVIRSTVPEDSVLVRDGSKYDYIDTYKGLLKDANDKIQSKDVCKAFFTSAPGWVDKLFELRNRMVSVVGLKTSGNIKNRQQLLDEFQCNPGQQLGLFKVFYRDEKEVILGEDDKHLNFRVSLYLNKATSDETQKELTISTTVKFNNWFGRLYFLPVKPFHSFIVPAMQKAIVKQLEK